jgi:hypothetical protein
VREQEQVLQDWVHQCLKLTMLKSPAQRTKAAVQAAACACCLQLRHALFAVLYSTAAAVIQQQ